LVEKLRLGALRLTLLDLATRNKTLKAEYCFFFHVILSQCGRDESRRRRSVLAHLTSFIEFGVKGAILDLEANTDGFLVL